jgi:hypothetical protein
MIPTNSREKYIKRQPRNILSNTTKLISSVPLLKNEFKERVPISGRLLLSTDYLGDKQKVTALKMFDSESAKKIENFLDKTNKVLDVKDKIDDFHTNLIERTPDSKKTYNEYKKNDYLGGRCKNKKSKKNKTLRQFKKKNKTRKNKSK